MEADIQPAAVLSTAFGSTDGPTQSPSTAQALPQVAVGSGGPVAGPGECTLGWLAAAQALAGDGLEQTPPRFGYQADGLGAAAIMLPSSTSAETAGQPAALQMAVVATEAQGLNDGLLGGQSFMEKKME